MLQIKILGSGCPNCRKLTELTERAIAGLGVEAKIEKVTDHNQIVGYNVLSTPGLVINEKVVSSGRIPSEAEITSMIATALMAN
ncbi:MAG TPA: thioredoxin family protein [Anaerolineales bacterium]